MNSYAETCCEWRRRNARWEPSWLSTNSTLVTSRIISKTLRISYFFGWESLLSNRSRLLLLSPLILKSCWLKWKNWKSKMIPSRCSFKFWRDLRSNKFALPSGQNIKNSFKPTPAITSTNQRSTHPPKKETTAAPAAATDSRRGEAREERRGGVTKERSPSRIFASDTKSFWKQGSLSCDDGCWWRMSIGKSETSDIILWVSSGKDSTTCLRWWSSGVYVIPNLDSGVGKTNLLSRF